MKRIYIIYKFFIITGLILSVQRKRNLIVLLMVSLFCGFLILAKNTINEFLNSWEESIIKNRGHIQIASRETFENPMLYDPENLIENPQEIVDTVTKEINVKKVTKRLLIQGVASSSLKSSFAIIAGLEKGDPSIEDMKVEELKGAVVGITLARFLEINEGEEVVIMANAEDYFPNAIGLEVQDITSFGNRQLNTSLIIAPLEKVQDLINTDKVSHISLYIQDPKEIYQVLGKINKILKSINPKLEAKTWKEIVEEYKFMQAMLSFQFNIIQFFFAVISSIVVFFLALLVVRGHLREIGTLKAFGMKNSEIFVLFISEGTSVGMASLLIGFTLGFLLTKAVASTGIPFVPPESTITVYIRPEFSLKNSAEVVYNLGIFMFISWVLAILYALKVSPEEAFKHGY